MICVAIVMVFITLKWLDIYTHHGEAIVVPNIKGLNAIEAKTTLKKANLKMIVSDSSYVKNAPAGTVLDINPAAGQRVKKGRTIYITLNTNKVPLFTVPDVADNSSRRQARARILASGFKLTEDELIPGEKDWVYGVKYNGNLLNIGDKIPDGSTLTLLVGDGMEIPVENDSIDGVEMMDVEPASISEPVNAAPKVDESWF